MNQRVRAIGHENITAKHTSTLELTTDDWLTPAGDCIVGLETTVAPTDFDNGFVEACQSRDAEITATLRVGGDEQVIEGRGDPALTFEDDRSMVLRTSDYVDDRTVMLDADTAAAGLDRDIVNRLTGGGELECLLVVEQE